MVYQLSNKINLHVHSTISDGKKTPKEIAQYMEQNNVVFSLTDHDRVDGIDEILDTLTNRDLFITGCEISVTIDNNYPILMVVHLLAYDFDLDKAKKYFKQIKEENVEVIQLIIKELSKKNIYVIEDVKSKTDIAKLLVKQNFALSINDAFESIINKITLNRYRSIDTVITDFQKMGAKVFLAHPFDILHNISKVKLHEREVENLVKLLVDSNLDGIECYYHNYNDDQINFLCTLANKYSLLKSSGVDSHFKEHENVFYQENLNLIDWVKK